MQRGYAIYSTHGQVSDGKYDGIRERLSIVLQLETSVVERLMALVPQIFEMLMLTVGKQSDISLWSGGPRPLVIPYGDVTIIDVAGLIGFLSRALTGIRDDGEIRGRRFEHTVRETFRKNLPDGFEIGPQKIKEGKNVKDEIDLMLRKADEVFVVECFSMGRPLDIELGIQSRIKKRLEQVEAKLDQAQQNLFVSGNSTRWSEFRF